MKKRNFKDTPVYYSNFEIFFTEA